MFLQLTDPGGDPVLLNSDKIIKVVTGYDAVTGILLDGHVVVEVQETYPYVAAMLGLVTPAATSNLHATGTLTGKHK
jgi:hypothetical protein